MIKVLMQKQCGCFKRSGLAVEESFETKEEALLKAQEKCDYMNNKFCQTHEFTVLQEQEDDNIVLIGVKVRV
jgi:hypothetical protein